MYKLSFRWIEIWKTLQVFSPLNLKSFQGQFLKLKEYLYYPNLLLSKINLQPLFFLEVEQGNLSPNRHIKISLILSTKSFDSDFSIIRCFYFHFLNQVSQYLMVFASYRLCIQAISFIFERFTIISWQTWL